MTDADRDAILTEIVLALNAETTNEREQHEEKALALLQAATA